MPTPSKKVFVADPWSYDLPRRGFSCPECGKIQVTNAEKTYLWCINKKCPEFAVRFDYDWKEK